MLRSTRRGNGGKAISEKVQSMHTNKKDETFQNKSKLI